MKAKTIGAAIALLIAYIIARGVGFALTLARVALPFGIVAALMWLIHHYK